MTLTPSTMVMLGTSAPDFTLLDTVSGEFRSLSQLRAAHATVIMFICNHCPYVKHVNAELVRLATEYQPRGVAFVAISSNDAHAYPQDGPEAMTRAARALGYPFVYLYDETQAVARDYRAACTPDFYVFDGRLTLAYRGQLDASRPGDGRPLTGRDLRAALDALLAGASVDAVQTPSVGCNIKFRTAV